MPSSSETHQFLCRLMIEKVYNEGELDLLSMLLAPDAITHELEDFGPAAAQGPETLGEMILIFRSAFPDLRLTVIDQLAGGDRVATRWRMEGTQSRRLMGIEARHRRVDVEGIRIDRIVDGRIAETWNQWDVMGLLRQLGALPRLQRKPMMALSAASVAA